MTVVLEIVHQLGRLILLPRTKLVVCQSLLFYKHNQDMLSLLKIQYCDLQEQVWNILSAPKTSQSGFST